MPESKSAARDNRLSFDRSWESWHASGSAGHPIYVSSHYSRCGGNLDCRELTEGTALFSTGDGHAVQGDGEVAGPVLNCPMEVVMEFQLHPELRLSLPRAHLASSGWLTFGFSRTLDEAAAMRETIQNSTDARRSEDDAVSKRFLC
jgi:acetamidase/formamidase